MSSRTHLDSIDSYLEAPIVAAILCGQVEHKHIPNLIGSIDFQCKHHRTITEVFLSLAQKEEEINLLSVQQRLAERNQLEKAGGRSYLAFLDKLVPNEKEHLKSHVKLLKEHSAQIGVIQHAAHMLETLTNQ